LETKNNVLEVASKDPRDGYFRAYLIYNGVALDFAVSEDAFMRLRKSGVQVRKPKGSR
jgi:hypothetical protein